MIKEMHCFLGANSEMGFYSLYNEFLTKAEKVYIIKGGPGTGKSTLMKQFYKKAAENGYNVEIIHCSADPQSLDGIFIKDKSLIIIDGTKPHIIDPPYPVAVGNIINLYPYCDSELIKKHKNQIIKLNSEISYNYERAYLYLAAAGKLQKDLNKIALKILNKTKLMGYFERLGAKQLKNKFKSAVDNKIFVSAITHNGFITFSDIFYYDDYKVLVIEDAYGISNKAIEIIKHKALRSGYNTISCYSPLCVNTLEHLIIPEAKFIICTSNSFHTITPKPYCRINISRFFNSGCEKDNKEKISFIKKAQKEIVNEAIKILKANYNKHIELEEIYKTYMDFESLNKYTDELVNKELIE